MERRGGKHSKGNVNTGLEGGLLLLRRRGGGGGHTPQLWPLAWSYERLSSQAHQSNASILLSFPSNAQCKSISGLDV